MISLGFGGRNKPLLGIDLSSSSVKIVELVKQGDKYHLKGYEKASLPEGAVVDKAVVDPIAVGEVISAVLKKLGTKVSDAAASVSGSAVITKVINVSAEFSDDQLENQIEIEADQHIPYPLDDVSLDFSIIGPSANNSDLNDVLLIACRRETVDAIVDAFDMAGLKAKVVDFEPYALQRALACLLDASDVDEQAIVVHVDVGANSLDVTVLHDGEIIYSREQAVGGKGLVSDLAATYSLSEDEAERQIARPELLPDGADSAVLAPFKSMILQQITRSLQLFFAATNYNDVDVIVLSGGVSAMAGLREMLQEDLGTRVIVADPLAFVDGTSIPDKVGLARNAPALMLCVGLAMWGS